MCHRRLPSATSFIGEGSSSAVVRRAARFSCGSEALAPYEVCGDGDDVSATGREPGRPGEVAGPDEVGCLLGGSGHRHAPTGTLVGVERVNVERDDLTVLPEVCVPAG